MTDQVSRKRMMFSDDSFIKALEFMDEHLKRSEFEIFESVESLIGFNNDDAKRLRSIRKDTESVRDAITNETAILREKMMKENKALEKKKISAKKIDELLKCSEHEFDRVKPLLIIAASLPPTRPDPVVRAPPPPHSGVTHPHRFGAPCHHRSG
ncbi:hypothetical protein OROGR_009278 [Orobanche gracilis]